MRFVREECKLIVLTPVKNEDWILEQFLATTSLFADCIIIADQNSSDHSPAICKNFEKVVFLKNLNCDYSESKRQQLLIDKARELFPNEKRILFGLDSDEIITHNSLQFAEVWDQIRSFSLGTTIFFEKPDILPGINQCVRWKKNYFPIAYVDDGAVHSPREIHSRRIPRNAAGKDVLIDEIKFLHFAISRNRIQSAKMRYYSLIENIQNTSPVYSRRRVYTSFFDPYMHYPRENFEWTPKEWIEGWLAYGIDLRSLPEPQYSWHDYEVLKMFLEFGCEKFHLENIWSFDWNCLLLKAHNDGMFLKLRKIIKPGFSARFLSRGLDLMNRVHKRLRSFYGLLF